MEIKCRKCGRETFSCSPIYEEVHCAVCGGNDWIPIEKLKDGKRK